MQRYDVNRKFTVPCLSQLSDAAVVANKLFPADAARFKIFNKYRFTFVKLESELIGSLKLGNVGVFTDNFWFPFSYPSAEQKAKHCLT